MRCATPEVARLILALLLVVLPVSARVGAAQTPAKATVESVVLVDGEPGLRYTISPVGHHLAAIVLRGSRKVVVVDGQEGPKFDDILSPEVVFSPDGSRFGYVGRQGQEIVYMVDGKELTRLPMARHPAARIHPVAFTPNSKHVWFLLYTELSGSSLDQWTTLVYDGKPGPEGFMVSEPVFGAGGDRYAAIVESRTNRGQRGIEVDGKLTTIPGGNPQFTADGLHLMTQAGIERSEAVDVLLDGKPWMRVPGGAVLHVAGTGSGVIGVIGSRTPSGGVGPWFLTAGNRRLPGSECPPDGAGYDEVTFSRDGMHFAARCAGPGRAWLVVDGKKQLEYAAVSNVEFTDDNRVVYVADQGGKRFVVVGDQESDAWEAVMPLTPRTPAENAVPRQRMVSGNRVGYIGLKASGSATRYVVIDGKATAANNPGNLSFSPDNSRYAFTQGQQLQLVVDGVEEQGIGFGPINLSLYQGLYVFSANGKHVAHVARRPADNVFGLAVDGTFIAMPDASRLDNFTFTPDGGHLFWLAQKAGGPNLFLYLDGQQLLELEPNLASLQQLGVAWAMGADGVLTFIAQEGDQMKRWRVTPGSGTSVESLLAMKQVR